MALTPEKIQAIQAWEAQQQAPAQPSVAVSPVGQVKAYENDLAVDKAKQLKNLDAAVDPKIAGDKAMAEALAKGEAEKQLNAKKEQDWKNQQIANADVVNQSIDDAISLARKPRNNGWIGNYLKGVGGTNAYDLDKKLSSVGANIGVDKVMQMRANSATGAGLGGNTSDKDLLALQSTLGSLDLGQSEEQLINTLMNAKKYYNNYQAGLRGEPASSQPSQPNNQPIPYTEYFK